LNLLLPPCFPEIKRRSRLSAAYRDLFENLRVFGAGEGARTLDPDLGKVVVLFQVVAKAPWIAPKHSV
jgi:hypothetical protein